MNMSDSIKEVLYTEEQLQARVKELGAQITKDYAGKDKLFGFFVGQTMKAMAGKANPAVVNDLLKKALG